MGYLGQRHLNTKLANYGIHIEESDWRIHVCVKAKVAYCFPREAAIVAVNQRATSNQDGHKVVTTGEIVTATGYAIPIEEIDPIYPIRIPPSWLSHKYNERAYITIHEQMSTTAKGDKAEKIVQALWRNGYLNFIQPISLQKQTEITMQHKGIDLIAVMPKVQIKCDFAGGAKDLGGTGNLFIQLSECNPYQQH